jgi:hypothetical protein
MKLVNYQGLDLVLSARIQSQLAQFVSHLIFLGRIMLHGNNHLHIYRNMYSIKK